MVIKTRNAFPKLLVATLAGVVPVAGYLAAQEPVPQAPAAPNQAMTAGNQDPLRTGEGFGSVGVESLDDLKTLVLEGPQDQVDSLLALIEAIDAMSVGSEPSIEVLPLEHADAESLAKLLTRIYEAKGTATPQTGGRRGTAGFIPMAQPNALVIVAQQNDITDAVKFAKDLDGESGRTGAQFKNFLLKNASAVIVRQKLLEFFAQRDDAAGLRVRIEVVADERTNSILVFAGPVDIQQAEQVIQKLDSNASQSVTDLRIFRLRNAVASELAAILQQAIVTRGLAATGQGVQGAGGLGAGGLAGQGGGGIANQFGGAGGIGQGAGNRQNALLGVNKSSKLRFLSTDQQGRPIESGILEDITINADDRSNSLIVTAPATSMELVAELIESLDLLPNPAAELKVFTLRNSDAEAMVETLSSIFQAQSSQTGAAGGQGNNLQSVAFSVGSQPLELSRVGLNFSTDVRTNSVIVSGTKGDLLAVEAMILKLDASNVRERQTIVFRLRNLTAAQAATAINEFLASQDVIAEGQEGRISFSEQISREVSVVPEDISNSLLISSTPRFFDEILRIVEEIDMRPAQVVIQVLIAEVQLDDTEEFGIELGTQSSVLYDRSLLVRNSGAAENSLNPGYNFNTTNPLQSPAGSPASEVGLQGLSNFALSRASSALGYGGLIFTASSDNVSILLRALKRQRRLDVLSRPQIMTLDNQQAFIQIGQQVPTVTASQTTVQGSVVNSVEFRDVGIILQVTPRISPDGVVVMRVDPTVSSLDPSGGIPISSGGDNAPVLAPIINTTRAQTTVSAADSQTVVIGGLINRSKQFEERKIPFIGDLPVVGWAFKTRFQSAFKRELLIILTPHVVRNECEAEYIKQMEAKRIDWIMKDVVAVQGDIGLPQDPIHEKNESGHDITIEEEYNTVDDGFVPSGTEPYQEGMIIETVPPAAPVEGEPMVPIEIKDGEQPPAATQSTPVPAAVPPAPPTGNPPDAAPTPPAPDYGPPPLPLDELKGNDGQPPAATPKLDATNGATPPNSAAVTPELNVPTPATPLTSSVEVGDMLSGIAVKNSAPARAATPVVTAPVNTTLSEAQPVSVPQATRGTAPKGSPIFFIKKRVPANEAPVIPEQKAPAPVPLLEQVPVALPKDVSATNVDAQTKTAGPAIGSPTVAATQIVLEPVKAAASPTNGPAGQAITPEAATGPAAPKSVKEAEVAPTRSKRKLSWRPTYGGK